MHNYAFNEICLGFYESSLLFSFLLLGDFFCGTLWLRLALKRNYERNYKRNYERDDERDDKHNDEPG